MVCLTAIIERSGSKMSVIKKILNVLNDKKLSVKNKVKLLYRAYSYHREKIEIESLYKKVKNTPVEGMILSDFYVTVDPTIRQSITKDVMNKISHTRYYERS